MKTRKLTDNTKMWIAAIICLIASLSIIIGFGLWARNDLIKERIDFIELLKAK